MTVYTENLKGSTRRKPQIVLELIGEFSKVVGYKSNIHKSNEHMNKEIKT